MLVDEVEVPPMQAHDKASIKLAQDVEVLKLLLA